MGWRKWLEGEARCSALQCPATAPGMVPTLMGSSEVQELGGAQRPKWRHMLGDSGGLPFRTKEAICCSHRGQGTPPTPQQEHPSLRALKDNKEKKKSLCPWRRHGLLVPHQWEPHCGAVGDLECSPRTWEPLVQSPPPHTAGGV